MATVAALPSAHGAAALAATNESDSSSSTSSFNPDKSETPLVAWINEAEEMNPSHRQTMEDASVTVSRFGDRADATLVGVFDGHGGRNVADYLQANLASNILTELQADPSRSVEEAMTSAFLITDIESTKSPSLLTSGSTAVVLLVCREGSNETQGRCGTVFAANVGDARAVLCRKGGAALRLTRDHKASDPDEVRRIERSGGFVVRKRVMGLLGITRSFGDFEFKRYVTARPYCSTTSILDTDEFIVCACDGVWDVFSDEEAVEWVRHALKTGKHTREDVAMGLVRAAIAKGSSDNVTCIIAGL